MPDGRLAVGTRRGEIWMVHNPLGKDPAKDAVFTRYAEGLHEILGLAYRDGWLYVTQRPEVTRIKDTKGHGTADVFETVAAPWEISGDYHEYAFGSKFDKDGNMYVALCLTGSFTSDAKFRGWCLRIGHDGKVTPWCSGVRSPGGIHYNAAGDLFYTDNQGPWNGGCCLKWLEQGKFMGPPGGNKWYDVAKNMGPRPRDPKTKSRWAVEMKKIPELNSPAVWFPYPQMGQSASGIAFDSMGKFGPFKDQLFVGDQAHSTAMRVFLEKINGRYQGAALLSAFCKGFSSGNLLAPHGAAGCQPHRRRHQPRLGLARHQAIRPGTSNLDRQSSLRSSRDASQAGWLRADVPPPGRSQDRRRYEVVQVPHVHLHLPGELRQPGSGSQSRTQPSIKPSSRPTAKSVRLYASKLEEGHIHELIMDGVRSTAGLPLLHNEVYYTLNYFALK